MGQTGHLDSIEDGFVRGWALGEHAESPATVEITVDGAVVATVACSQFRPDLVKAGKGTGWHGFSYWLPEKYARGQRTLTVRFADTGRILHGGPQALPDFTFRILSSSAIASSVLGNGLWCMEKLDFSESEVAIAGWCIPPRTMPAPISFTHNGNSLLDLVRIRRDDIAALMGLNSDEIGLGFRARGPLSTSCKRHDFTFAHAYSKRPFDTNQTIHYISSDEPLPPEELRVRVHGSTDVLDFVREGSTAYVRIERIVAEYFSKSINDFEHVLDWGCGSGRMLRYFANTADTKITGIDIDAQAIEWCRRAFPRCEFLAIETEPPTSIPNETFDLIYGTSVLTHLSEGDHIKWLQELHRLAKPHGVILLTTAGDRDWWGCKLPHQLFTTWQIDYRGFFNSGRNNDLDDLGVGDYYRNVFVSRDYISRNWSRYFDIVDFLPQAIGNLQDLTILQKRE